MFNGKGGQSLGAMEIQFLHEVGSVFLHGFDADAKFLGNLFISIPLCDQFQNLPLSGGKGLPGGFGF